MNTFVWRDQLFVWVKMSEGVLKRARGLCGAVANEKIMAMNAETGVATILPIASIDSPLQKEMMQQAFSAKELMRQADRLPEDVDQREYASGKANATTATEIEESIRKAVTLMEEDAARREEMVRRHLMAARSFRR
jgi:hypothetical protein